MRSEAALAVLVLVLDARAGAAVVERILAVVDGRPVLLSEVALFQKARGEDPAHALEEYIDEQLMYREATRLPQAAVSAAEEERALESLRTREGALSADEQEQLRRLARREAAIVKYIDFRFRPQVRIGDDAVRTAWEAEGRAYAESFEEAAPRLRARLAEEDLNRRIEAWVKDLRQGADVRYNGAPSPEASPAS